MLSIRSMPWVRGPFFLTQALVGLVGRSRGEPSAFSVAAVRGEEALIAAAGRVWFRPVSLVYGR